MNAVKRFSLFPVRLRLLPTVMALAAVALIVRAGHFAGDLSRFVGQASAQEEVQPERPSGGEAAEQEPASAPEDRGADAASAPTSPAAEDLQELTGVSGSERQLLEELAERRRELEKREQEVGLREQLLASTERRIDRKIAQLKTLEQRLEDLVASHEERENKQLESIVKVYETMKPKDAAAVFQRLDLGIQTQVATRMKDRSMAALLAEMDPDAAKILTTRLATRNELPDAAQLLEDTPPS